MESPLLSRRGSPRGGSPRRGGQSLVAKSWLAGLFTLAWFVLSIVWMCNHGFNPFVSDLDDLARYAPPGSAPAAQQWGGMAPAMGFWNRPERPRNCDASPLEWQCGCKKRKVNGTVVAQEIDYDGVGSLGDEGAGAGPRMPRVVHFLSRMFSDASREDSKEAAGKVMGIARDVFKSIQKRKREDSPEWCGDVPCEYKPYMDQYLATFEDGWEFDLHCGNEIAALLQKHTPSLWTIYESFSADIQRSDTARYVLLYLFGGLYSDMDVEPWTNLTSLLSGKKEREAGVILGTEALMDAPPMEEKMKELSERCEVAAVADAAAHVYADEKAVERPSPLLLPLCEQCSGPIGRLSLAELMGCVHGIRAGRREQNVRVANYWMMSVPGHPFWQDVLELVQRRSQLELSEQYDILYTTGPDVVSEIYSLWSAGAVPGESQRSGGGVGGVGGDAIRLISHEQLVGLNEHWTKTSHSWRAAYNSELCDDLGLC